MPNPNVALVIGSPPDLPVIEVVERCARENGWQYAEPKTVDETLELLAKDPGLGSSCTLALLCARDSATWLPQEVLRLATVRSDARVLVSVADQTSGDLAMKCARARDYLVYDYGLADLEMHVAAAFKGKPAYPVFHCAASLRAGSSVFFAFQYDEDGWRTYLWAAAPAVERLGSTPVTGADTIVAAPIGVKTQDLITKCDVFVGNISGSRKKGVNRNVLNELGFAQGQGKPCLLIRALKAPQDGASAIPTDLHGLERVDYYTHADLAWKLYCALGGKIPLP